MKLKNGNTNDLLQKITNLSNSDILVAQYSDAEEIFKSYLDGYVFILEEELEIIITSDTNGMKDVSHRSKHKTTPFPRFLFPNFTLNFDSLRPLS